jgi:hypothetical protein
MKKILSVIAILIISTLCFASCNIIKDKEATKATADEYFNFVEVDGGYAISAKEDVTLPATVQLPATYNEQDVVEIAKNGFKNNTTVTKVIIPEGYRTIGNEAFAYCTALATVEVGSIQGTTAKGVTVGMSAFKGCTSLTDVRLGKDVKVINAYAFYETKISSVVTLKNVEKVGSQAFGKCERLSKFYIPASLVDIAEDAFTGSNNVKFEIAESNTVYDVVNNEIVKL